MTASIINLNHPAHYVHWHFFNMSVANLAVIVAMLVVFALAILLPFPGARGRRAAAQGAGDGGQGAVGGAP